MRMKVSKLRSVAGLALGLALDTATFTHAADAAAKEKAKPYLLKTCLVSGEKLDSMGEPFVFVKDGQ